MPKLLLALALALVPCASQAQDATIQAAHRKVYIKPWGQKRFVRAKEGDGLIFGDTVRTGRKARAHIALASGATVLLQERSQFQLRGTANDPMADFKVGEFLVGLLRKLKKGQSFRVRVPAAVAAVRGTLFWGKTDGRKQATFAGFGDKVTITAEGKKVTLKPGEIVTIDPGEPPSRPKPHDIGRDYLRTFEVSGSLQGLGDLVDDKIK